MDSTKILEQTKKLVSKDREEKHGDKVINHQNIGKLWSAYLGVPITAHDVAICMALLKIARAKFGNPTPDTYIDGSAYMAIAGECRKLEKPQPKETWAEGYNKWKEEK